MTDEDLQNMGERARNLEDVQLKPGVPVVAKISIGAEEYRKALEKHLKNIKEEKTNV